MLTIHMRRYPASMGLLIAMVVTVAGGCGGGGDAAVTSGGATSSYATPTSARATQPISEPSAPAATVTASEAPTVERDRIGDESIPGYAEGYLDLAVNFAMSGPEPVDRGNPLAFVKGFCQTLWNERWSAVTPPGLRAGWEMGCGDASLDADAGELAPFGADEESFNSVFVGCARQIVNPTFTTTTDWGAEPYSMPGKLAKAMMGCITEINPEYVCGALDDGRIACAYGADAPSYVIVEDDPTFRAYLPGVGL